QYAVAAPFPAVARRSRWPAAHDLAAHRGQRRPAQQMTTLDDGTRCRHVFLARRSRDGGADAASCDSRHRA
ncbi:MAG: hypothetical protein WBG81_03565, partial [Rhodanobacter sp.]